MIRAILVLIGVPSLAIVACASSSNPASDVPQFSDGEAIALVKTRLSEMTFDTVRAVDPNTGRLRLVRRGESSETVVIRNSCLTLYRAHKWGDEYLGEGVWLVTAQTDARQSEWRVYEASGSLDSVGLPGRC